MISCSILWFPQASRGPVVEKHCPSVHWLIRGLSQTPASRCYATVGGFADTIPISWLGRSTRKTGSSYIQKALTQSCYVTNTMTPYSG